MNPPKFDGATDRSIDRGRSVESLMSLMSERARHKLAPHIYAVNTLLPLLRVPHVSCVFSLIKYHIVTYANASVRNDNDTYLEGPPRAPSPFLPSSLREVQTVEMCPAIFLSFGRRNWVSNNSCCHAGPTAAKSQRTKVMARGMRSQSFLGTTSI